MFKSILNIDLSLGEQEEAYWIERLAHSDIIAFLLWVWFWRNHGVYEDFLWQIKSILDSEWRKVEQIGYREVDAALGCVITCRKRAIDGEKHLFEPNRNEHRSFSRKWEKLH